MSSLLLEEIAFSHSCLSSDAFIQVYSQAGRATDKGVLVRGSVNPHKSLHTGDVGTL